jgi:hypothetical protein
MKPIKDFPGYFADESGNIFSKLPWGKGAKPPSEPRRLKPGKDGGGYLIVGLQKDGKQYTRKVHQLILETFVGKCPNGMEACHLNGVRDDNRLKNLRWDTPKANCADRKLHGTHPNGEKNGRHKLNEMQVRVIRRCCESGMMQTETAEVFGVNQLAISRIVHRKTWGHLL